ncbi:MCM DNA helicase complex subunit [Friedmanniomyces endolithicus]|nr:MCM DNA helicase complex subunit [Friedmanniomyces endolithicus]KAK0808668.1 MCM DNA helicase complex subunit [Friedmanniomyces endolithicus]KAK0813099.1 MCM DNA helicase complex subunit [Friedmanniomyces endolithicus]
MLNQTLGVGLADEADADKPSEVYEKFNVMLHAGVTVTVGRGAQRKVEVLSIPFIKKYIHALRNDEMEGNQRKTTPMTPRTLETLIRLASAHAKARLSQKVEEKDAIVAEGILRFALFKEVVADERRRKKKARTSPDPEAMSTDDDSSDDDDGDAADAAFRPGAAAARRSTPRTPGGGRRGGTNGTNGHAAAGAGEENEEEEDLYNSTPVPARRTTTQSSGPNGSQDTSQVSMASSQPASQLLQDASQSQDQQIEEDESSQTISVPRLQAFQTALGQLINGPLFANDAADVEPLIAAVNARLRGGEAVFDDAEAMRALEELNERNKIMLSGGIVYKI